MGLCIGELNDDIRSDFKFTYTGTEMSTVPEKMDTIRIVYIHSVTILRRSDKRKDHIEISPEQLCAALREAERLAELTGSPMGVVGWYHSHTHITVWPSHVDVGAQAMYQMMDQGFVGLIFFLFYRRQKHKDWLGTLYLLPIHTNPPKAQNMRELKFQSTLCLIPLITIGKVCLESALELPKILCQEEQDAYRRIHSLTHLDSVTKIHNVSVFTKNVCSQMSAVVGVEENQQHLQELQQEKEELMEELPSLE